MKKVFTLFAALLVAVSVFAQAPQSFSYQAVVRNNSGAIVAKQAVAFRISLLQGSTTGTVVYSEIQGVTTNEFGLVNFQVGKGTATTGTFSSINWGSSTYFAKVELDINGGSNFIEMSTSQLLSVPYALHATTASSVSEALKVSPRIASRYNSVAVSFTGGTEVSFSQSSSACPAVQATVVLRMTQGTRTYSATPTSIFYIDSKRFDALFDSFYYVPAGLYDIIIGNSNCPIQLNSAFKIVD